MSDLVRQEIMTATDLVVVKVGTRVLANPDGTLNRERVAAVADQLAVLSKAGKKCVLVSSGAVGAGIGRLGWTKRPTDLARLQAAAAIGQSLLIESYNQTFEPHQLHAAQVLLTAEDLKDRTRYLNVRNTLFALFAASAVPIINENDTVSVEELQLSFGDNDRLAALVTNLIRAPLLILLSDIDGVYAGDPKNPESKVLSVITDVAAARQEFVHDQSHGQTVQLSRGGMANKLNAVRIATSAGENVVIANGRRERVLLDILEGKDVGTLFLAEGPTVDSRRRWIGWSARPSGRLFLDQGACRAITQQGRSLLPVGVTRIEGAFAKGDVVSLCDEQGAELARGLTNYPAAELKTIIGQSSNSITQVLGHRPYDEVVHRNNLIVLH